MNVPESVNRDSTTRLTIGRMQFRAAGGDLPR